MGVVIDFAERQIRAKIQKLLKESEEIMDEYNAYRAKHPDAVVGSVARKAGMVIYKKYLKVTDEALKLTDKLKEPYTFCTKYIAWSRSGTMGTDFNGGLTININGLSKVTLNKGEE
jgi:hypothetical protein